ncbi:MAG: CheR family methyltransferase [Desulfuromonadales bacterium]|nr:CheR family methyltransferase [Desulfuromonadales bacterium]
MSRQNQDRQKKTTPSKKDDMKSRNPENKPGTKSAVKGPRENTKKWSTMPVVGIGASAGGLKALRELLEELPADTGMAFVLIQHLNPSHESSLPEILAKATPMAVQTAQDGQPLQPDTLSIIPPGYSLALEGRTLHLEKREQPPGTFRPIDSFFMAMAREFREQAIAVVLSGSNSDGAKGVIDVRNAGGLTLVQTEKTAEYTSMPRQALLTGKVDFCGSAIEIGRLLGNIARHPHLYPEALPEPPRTATDTENELEPIQQLLRKTGVDFSNYKQSTVRRRIMRRMALNRVQTLSDYAARLADSPDELKILKEDLLIKVTSFFRNQEVFDTLKQQVFPALLKNRDRDQPVRIWVPGCASGEEVYSLAISLLEYLGNQSTGIQVQIFGTDLSDSAIEKARHGLYSEADLAEVESRRIEKFFDKTRQGYQIKKLVREMCVFARQDFTIDPPFSRLDLISCRNVLIYLGPVLQKRVIPLFHYALNSGGYLLLGQSESIGQFDGMFSMIDPKARIYVKKVGIEHSKIEFWPGRSLRDVHRQNHTMDKRQSAPGTTQEPNLEREVELLLLRKYNRAAVVVDRDLKIRHFRGDTGSFLQPVPGKATLDLLKMVRDPLRLELQTLIHLACKDGESKCREGLDVQLDEGERLVQLEVIPFSAGEDQQFFLVEFHAQPAVTGDDNQVSDESLPAAYQRELVRLKQDLAASHAYQQTLIEDKDHALEDLRTANEEILSSNEELQSLNEELETAKEELESSNEELSTVNQELQDRNEELSRSHEDLSNLIASAEIPFVIVNKEMIIRRISPTAGEHLNVRRSDVGRPLSDINLRLKLPNLESSLKQVMDFGQPLEHELLDAERRWKLLRIRPYRTVADKIEGAVLTLIDIDRLKQSIAEVERAFQYALDIVEAVKLPLLVLDKNFRVQTANPAFYQKFQVSPAETEGKLIFELGSGQWNNSDLQQLLEEILPKSRQMDDFLVKIDFPALGERSMLVSARPMTAREERILLSIQDITSRLDMENAMRLAKQRAEAASQAKSQFLANMSHEIRTPMTIVLGALDFLQNANLNEPQAKCLALAETASKGLLELLGDILDFSKIEARHLILEHKPFNIRECVEETAAILRSMAERKGLSLHLEIADEVPATIFGDQNRLRQILTNLISNAIKFTDAGSIAVSAELSEVTKVKSPQELFFTVKDSGCGIPVSKLGLLFESFSQVDASITRRYGGSGLGLSICKGIVEQMGGKIWVESIEGKGSSFFFTMPFDNNQRISRRSQFTATPAPANAGRKPFPLCHILLAEDDPDIQQVMQVILAHKKWKLDIVSDGEAAVKAFEKGGIDLILMDVHMRGTDGLAATRIIRSMEPQGQHIPIVALTADVLQETRKACLDAGMDNIIGKPLLKKDLEILVERYCKQPQLQDKR